MDGSSKQTLPSTAQPQLPTSLAGSPDTSTDLNEHLEPKSTSQILNEHNLPEPGSSDMSTTKEKGINLPANPIPQRSSMLHGGRVSTSRSALHRKSNVFASSPLAHAETALLSSPVLRQDAGEQTVAAPSSPTGVDHDNAPKELSDVVAADHQLLHEMQATSSSVKANRVHPTVSAYSEEALSFPNVNQNTLRRSFSPLKETVLTAPEQRVNDDETTPGEPTVDALRKASSFSATGKAGGEIEVPGEPTPITGHPLRKGSTVPNHPHGQTFLDPLQRKENIVETPARPVFKQGIPLRKIPSLSSTPSNPSSRKRAGPPISLYEEAFLRIVDTVADKDETDDTQLPRLSFTPISNLKPLPAPPPLPVKQTKKKRVTEPEDPFEGFNSGSEKDADSDADFDAGDTISEASVEDEEGIASEEDYQGKKIPVATQARKRKERGSENQDESIPRPRVIKTDHPTANKAFKSTKGIIDDPVTMQRSRSLNSFRGFEDDDRVDVEHPGDRRASGGDKMKVQGEGERNGKDWALVVSKVHGKRVEEWKNVNWMGWGANGH